MDTYIAVHGRMELIAWRTFQLLWEVLLLYRAVYRYNTGDWLYLNAIESQLSVTYSLQLGISYLRAIMLCRSKFDARVSRLEIPPEILDMAFIPSMGLVFTAPTFHPLST